MKVINISKKALSSLQPLELSHHILNTEAQMFLFPYKNKWKTEELILKKLYHTSGEVYGNKLYTINALLDIKDEINIEELVMPVALATVSHEIIGYVMPYIPSVNLQDLLDAPSYDVSLDTKIHYLKEVGKLLKKMQQLREHSLFKEFYLNDVHEGNFILNTETKTIKAVDLDSVKIGNNLASSSKYLNKATSAYFSPKYKYSPNNVGGEFVINNDTELYCYTMMILNFFYGDNVASMAISDYYVYLDFLRSLGISYEIIDIFASLFINKENQNLEEYLDDLKPFYGKTHKWVYTRRRDNRKNLG